ncbi:hypothetical protein CLV62_11211 [Dysgonomonas alginatilytica]|uniref:Uncharacterized protein n=1 Tax=Dysgonomonas alginatilytica TaxID=1605892 RepID=A0A2V3PMW8_9BACT|nr:hypothetical protein [Dysgonomonas alginatilytica]PXV63762.1 hypothetical protein CLV62_11211 [Dysgonomonas alginatilytica]
MSKYKLNNWIPGADIEIDQLIKTEDYFTENLIDSLAIEITDTNYGLLPLQSSQNESCKLELELQDKGTARLNLTHCNGITRTGYVIHYDSAHNQPIHTLLDFGLQDTEEETLPSYWDVVLTVNPFQRVPLANTGKNKKIPTDLFTASLFSLSVVSAFSSGKNEKGVYNLIIGRIVKNADAFMLDSQYIPPCTEMESHCELIRYNALFGKHLNELERVSCNIIEKIHSRPHKSPLEESVFGICKAIIMYIAEIHFRYRNMSSYSTPVKNITYFSSLASQIQMTLAKLTKTDKEELLKYFQQWNDVTPGAFEEMLKNTSQIKYNHNDIRPAMTQLEQFLIFITDLWHTLNGLHFIGQHKENIVISERIKEPDTPKSTGSWVIFD